MNQLAVDQEIVLERVVDPKVDEIAAFYSKQGHPLGSARDKIKRMLDGAVCLVVARREGQLVGLARGVSDGVTGRLAECKLDPTCQGPGCITRRDGRIEHDDAGVAKKMASMVLDELARLGVDRIEVLAHSTEIDFCAELGFKKIRGMEALELSSVAISGLQSDRSGRTSS